MQKEELIKKEYIKPNARLVVFNYREVVMASTPEEINEKTITEFDDPPGLDEVEERTEH